MGPAAYWGLRILQNNTAPALKQLSVQCRRQASGSIQHNTQKSYDWGYCGGGDGAILAQSRGSGKSFPGEVTSELGQVSGQEKIEKGYLRQRQQGWVVEGSLSSLFAVFYLKDRGIASHRSGSFLKKCMH